MKFPIYRKSGADVVVVANKKNHNDKAIGLRIDNDGSHANLVENILSYIYSGVDIHEELDFLYTPKEIELLYNHLINVLKIKESRISWHISCIHEIRDEPIGYLIVSKSFLKLLKL